MIFIFFFCFSAVSSFNNGSTQSVNLVKAKKGSPITLIQQKRLDSLALEKEKKELIEYIKKSVDTIINQDKKIIENE